MAVNTKIVLENTIDGYLAEGKAIKGAFVTYATAAERDATLVVALVAGSLCYVKSDGKFYEWTGATWTEKQLGGGGSGGNDPRFVINDPEDGQILIYDDVTAKWINKDLADEESIVYLSERGLTIQGYASAQPGQMLVKSADDGLTWLNPLSEQTLINYTNQAATSANTAGTYATNAGNSATRAAESATAANRINQQTMAWFNNKFWWGTIDEYNALESISPGTFYFIKSAD